MSKNAKPNINQKIADLKDSMQWFYGDEFSLDQAADQYKKALGLAEEIQQDLTALKNQIDVIDKDFTKE